MSYSKIVSEDIRLSLLCLLEKDSSYSHNEYVLGRSLEMLGHSIGTDRVRTELHWLAEQGLLGLQTVGDSTVVAILTARGADVALGRTQVPGVARPRPSL